MKLDVRSLEDIGNLGVMPMRRTLLAFTFFLLVSSNATSVRAEVGDVGVLCEAWIGRRFDHHFSGTFKIPASKDSITWLTEGPKDSLQGFVASPNDYAFTIHVQVGDTTYDLRLRINRTTLDLRIEHLETDMSRPDLPVFDSRNKVILKSTGDYRPGSCKRVAIDGGI